MFSGMKFTFQAEFIKQHKLLGAMVWAMDLDDVSGSCGNGKFPLLHVLREGLSDGESVVG